MTPKEKAKELVDKMKLKVDVIDENNYTAENEYGAIQCALICVDEILESLWNVGHSFSNDEIKYWQEVKKEIEKL